MQRKCRTSLQFHMTPPLYPRCSPRLLVESTSLMRWLSGCWRCVFNSLTDISASISVHLSLMTAVRPLQQRKRRFWFLVTSCRLPGRCHRSAATILLPLCRLRGPVVIGEKSECHRSRSENLVGDLMLVVCQHQQIRWNKNRSNWKLLKNLSKHTWREIPLIN